jgi:high-affinity iron transporter
VDELFGIVRRAVARNMLGPVTAGAALLLVAAAFVWPGFTQHGDPDPVNPRLTLAAAVLDTGILVFREGLEAVLVLAAVFASLGPDEPSVARPVCWGIGGGLAATLGTWWSFGAVLAAIDAPVPDALAATAAIAVAVLLVVMNWVFHRVYWTGWIQQHTRAARGLGLSAGHSAAIWRGLAAVGFSAMYREGFEVVVFLQNTRLEVGHRATLTGAAIGTALTLITAGLMWGATRRLPYRKMLVATGVLLGAVLVAMVGETVLQMQQAGWIGTNAVAVPIPAWAETWLSVYPSVQGLTAQTAAVSLVLGSYWFVGTVRGERIPSSASSRPAGPQMSPRFDRL